jgi:hypothetical protein
METVLECNNEITISFYPSHPIMSTWKFSRILCLTTANFYQVSVCPTGQVSGPDSLCQMRIFVLRYNDAWHYTSMSETAIIMQVGISTKITPILIEEAR